MQLPAPVLAGQGQELPRGRRAGLAERLEQPLDHGPDGRSAATTIFYRGG